jgi:hypothetical protein
LRSGLPLLADRPDGTGRPRGPSRTLLAAFADDDAAFLPRSAEHGDAGGRVVDDPELEVAALVGLRREAAIERNVRVDFVGRTEDPQLAAGDPRTLDLHARLGGRRAAKSCCDNT